MNTRPAPRIRRCTSDEAGERFHGEAGEEGGEAKKHGQEAGGEGGGQEDRGQKGTDPEGEAESREPRGGAQDRVEGGRSFEGVREGEGACLDAQAEKKASVEAFARGFEQALG